MNSYKIMSRRIPQLNPRAPISSALPSAAIGHALISVSKTKCSVSVMSAMLLLARLRDADRF